jgi:hypothetical protein
MARRMTDTAKWGDEWFMELSPATKLLWFYLCDQCDHAGLWKVNRRLAETQMGRAIDWEKATTELGSRILVVGDRWHIRKFVEFQYGPVPNEKNNAHAGVLKVLRSFSLSWGSPGASQPHPSPCLGALGMDKDKEMDSRGESAERGARKAEFKALLTRLLVCDGPKAFPKWQALATSNPQARTFEERCALVTYCVEQGRRAGAEVNYASDVVSWAAGWRP